MSSSPRPTSVEEDLRQLISQSKDETNDTSESRTSEIATKYVFPGVNAETSGYSKEQEKESKSLAVQATAKFDWGEYLTASCTEAAPASCFFQAENPPENLFKEDDKIEMPDPRGPSESLCLANVEAVHRAWLCVRLCGCDDANDQWLIADSKLIHAVGHAARTSHGALRPPIGYQHNLAKFGDFVDKQLRQGRAAPDHCFKPIDESLRPKSNGFQVGMKLEAVDPKNFNGNLAVATVASVRFDEVEINFDGWPPAYNLTLPFDSRSLFPVGWANKAAVELDPPRKQKGRVGKISNKPAPVPQRAAKTEETPKVRKKPGPKPKQSLDAEDAGRKGKGAHLSQVMRRVKSMGQSETDSDGGSGTPAKHMRKIAPKPAAPTSEPVARARKTIAPASQSPSQPAPLVQQQLQLTGFFKPTPAASALASSAQSTQAHQLCVYVNSGCACGPWMDPERLRVHKPTQIGPADTNHVAREVVQLLLNCAADRGAVFRKIQPSASATDAMTVTADFGNRTNLRLMPLFGSADAAWTYVAALVESVGACRNLLARSAAPCARCTPDADDLRRLAPPPPPPPPSRHRRRRSPSVDAADDSESIHSSTTERDGGAAGVSVKPLEQWSVGEVAESMERLGDADIANAFRQNMIDGKALMLLSPDLMIKHMQFRLGPALKVAEHIEHLRRAGHSPRNQ